MIARTAALLLVFAMTPLDLVPGSQFSGVDVHRLAQEALAASGETADTAIAQLRAVGPGVLPPLFEMRQEIHDRSSSVSDAETAKALRDQLEKMETLIDRVAGQRYASVSRLFWYTDFEQAKAAAVAAGKPILSLRLLGKLTDEFSCANSRFFRTTLYANKEISQQLRDHFVLHWQSVRPVPRVTIDFGDGRKLERTLTGNSAHYALAPNGQPLDALPGLYGPGQFLEWLQEVDSLYSQIAVLSGPDRRQRLEEYHRAHGQKIALEWAHELWAVAPDKVLAVTNTAPSAFKAAQIAVSKAIVEVPIVRQIASDPSAVMQATTDDLWAKIAALPGHSVELDPASKLVIRRENPAAAQAGARSATKRKVEDPILRLLRNLQTSIAVDTVRNEYTLHRAVHQWFAAGAAGTDVDQLNERVYAELFLTPSNDPWLGLAPSDAYTALKNGGAVQASP